MSKSTFADAMQSWEAHYAAQVLADTWGYPQPQVRYPVKVLLCHGEHGDHTPIRTDFPDDCGNPFFWDDFSFFLCDLPTKTGEIYWWEGYYLKYKNGNFRFTGKLTHVPVEESAE